MISIQDRTNEFQQAVGNFGRQLGANRPTPVTSQGMKKNEFTLKAGNIARDIVKVTGTLSKLAQLAKRKEMLSDKPSEVVELTYVIKQEIFRIEKELKNLSKSGNIGSGSGNGNGNGQELKTYNKNVVTLLNTKTKNISENFKTVLEERQKSEMIRRARQEQLMAVVGINNDSNNNNNNNNNIPYALRNKGNDNPFLATLQGEDSNGASGSGNDGAGAELSLPDQSQQLLLLEEQQNQYMQERSNAVQAIEATINEVGGLFQQLATMVQEQGEVIQRIDDNIEDVGLNISGAHTELSKYYNSVSSNRWLILQVFAIIIVFFLVWVLVS